MRTREVSRPSILFFYIYLYMGGWKRRAESRSSSNFFLLTLARFPAGLKYCNSTKGTRNLWGVTSTAHTVSLLISSLFHDVMKTTSTTNDSDDYVKGRKWSDKQRPWNAVMKGRNKERKKERRKSPILSRILLSAAKHTTLFANVRVTDHGNAWSPGPVVQCLV